MKGGGFAHVTCSVCSYFAFWLCYISFWGVTVGLSTWDMQQLFFMYSDVKGENLYIKMPEISLKCSKFYPQHGAAVTESLV